MFHEVGLNGHAQRTIACAFILAFAALPMQCAPLLTQPPPAAQTSVFKDCDVCPEMVVLPGADVALGRFEVTLEEYRAFGKAVPDAAPETPCNSRYPRRSWRAAGYLQTERHPVACVSWNEAQTYVRWLSLETGHLYRLPTETEWDRGAAGSPKGCNQFFTKERGTCVVGTYPPSDAGIFDMAGNLREWTNDCWDSQALIRKGDCGRKVLRGAGWESLDWRITADARKLAPPHGRGNMIGFRVARTLP